MIYVRPAPGRRVRDPVSGQVLDAAGAWVADSSFWQRRIRDADVEAFDQAPA
jgi:hypothetical protein